MRGRVFLTILAALAVAGPAAAQAPPGSYVLPGNAVYPEGITFEESTGNFYVTSTQDGTIFRGNVDAPEASVFIPGDGRLFSAIGTKVDDAADRLYVAGGRTGEVRVHSTATGALLQTLQTGEGGFLNDLVLTGSGIFVTDSMRPILWRVPPGGGSIEPFLDFTGTTLQYQPGFNLNGIVVTDDGRYLVVSQSNTGRVFRITIATKDVVGIDLGFDRVPGDGLLLRGQTLYAVAGGGVVRVTLSGDFTSGRVYSRTFDRRFRSPTTIAFARDRLLVVNSQFPARTGGYPPQLPFTVTSIGIP